MTNGDESNTSKPSSNGITVKEFFTLWINELEKNISERSESMGEKFITIEEARKLALDAVEQKFKATEEARRLALEAMDKRLDTMNEFRATLRDQSTTFMTKVAHEAYVEKVDLQIRQLQDFKLLLDTKASSRDVTWSWILSAISIVIGISAVLTKIFTK